MIILKMPSQPNINLSNCLILQSRASMASIPQKFATYFINSKRRFFLYFKYHRQMLETMRIFTELGIRFYRRESLLPDREEYEEQVFHCNYKYKKIDLRKSVERTSVYNEPRLHFDRHERSRRQDLHRIGQRSVRQTEIKLQMKQSKQEESKRQSSPIEPLSFNGFAIRDARVKQILQDKELIRKILISEQN